MTKAELQTERSALEGEIARLRGRLETAEWALLAAQSRGIRTRGLWVGVALGGALVVAGFFFLAIMALRVVAHID